MTSYILAGSPVLVVEKESNMTRTERTAQRPTRLVALSRPLGLGREGQPRALCLVARVGSAVTHARAML